MDMTEKQKVGVSGSNPIPRFYFSEQPEMFRFLGPHPILEVVNQKAFFNLSQK